MVHLFAAVMLLAALQGWEESAQTLRERWASQDARLQPDRVMRHLNLQPGDVVADLGAGKGYFTQYLCRAVGPEGRIIALDVNPGALEINKRLALEDGLTNLETRIVAHNDPGLEPGEVDLVFISRTWHFFPERMLYARRLRNSMRADARLAVIGYNSNFLPRLLRHHPRRSSNGPEMRRETESAGFRVLEAHHFIPAYFFMILQPGRAAIFDEIEEFAYFSAELAMGQGTMSDHAIASLAERGFLKIVDLSENTRLTGEQQAALQDLSMFYAHRPFSMETAESLLTGKFLSGGDDSGRDVIEQLISELKGSIVFLWGDDADQCAAVAYGMGEVIGLTDAESELLLQKTDVLEHPITRVIQATLGP